MLKFHIVRTDMGGFPSGQRGQTVNLLQIASVVRIHLHPFARAGVAHGADGFAVCQTYAKRLPGRSCRVLCAALAGVAEQADARDLKSLGGNIVPVQVRPPAVYGEYEIRQRVEKTLINSMVSLFFYAVEFVCTCMYDTDFGGVCVGFNEKV